MYSNFVRLNEKTFTDLLKSDLLNVTREIYVYYALKKWLEHNQRGDLHEKLFGLIRLHAFNCEELELILKTDKNVASNASLSLQVTCMLEKFVTPTAFASSSSSSATPSAAQASEAADSSEALTPSQPTRRKRDVF